jgi:WhiB family redox-sensing transcriptional regulator
MTAVSDPKSVQIQIQPAPSLTNWHEFALCTQTDPDSFYPEKGGTPRDTKRICAMCEVTAECLAYALKNDERYGIWGGHTENERRQLRRQSRYETFRPVKENRYSSPPSKSWQKRRRQALREAFLASPTGSLMLTAETMQKLTTTLEFSHCDRPLEALETFFKLEIKFGRLTQEHQDGLSVITNYVMTRQSRSQVPYTSQSIKTDVRTIALLRWIEAAGGSIGRESSAAAIAEVVRMPQPSVHSLLAKVIRQGYIERVLQGRIPVSITLMQAGRDYLESLTKKTTSNVNRLSNDAQDDTMRPTSPKKRATHLQLVPNLVANPAASYEDPLVWFRKLEHDRGRSSVAHLKNFYAAAKPPHAPGRSHWLAALQKGLTLLDPPIASSIEVN